MCSGSVEEDPAALGYLHPEREHDLPLGVEPAGGAPLHAIDGERGNAGATSQLRFGHQPLLAKLLDGVANLVLVGHSPLHGCGKPMAMLDRRGMWESNPLIPHCDLIERSLICH